MNISEIIFNQMKKKGLSQKEFSKMTGIPESTISDWKKKGNTPKAEKLYDISRTLGISLYELLGVRDETASDEVDYVLSDSESELIEAYRKSGMEQQKRIIIYAFELSRGISAGKDLGDSEKTGEKNSLEKKNKEKGVIDSGLILQKQLARRLRRLARLDRITIDESEHFSGLNKHLFKYLDYLGIDKL